MASAVRIYLENAIAGDPVKACDQVSAAGKQELVRLAKSAELEAENCVTAVRGIAGGTRDQLGENGVNAYRGLVAKAELSPTFLDDSTATVTPKVDGDPLNPITLKRIDDRWRIDSGFNTP